jgi:hypothetical protein
MFSKCRLGAIIATIMIFLIAICVLPRIRDSEPQFEARSLSSWIDENSSRSAEAIRKIGPAACPHLVEWAAAGDHQLGFLRRQVHEWFGIDSGDATARKHCRALAGFTALQENGADALPALKRLLLSNETSPMAGLCLQSIGPCALPTLLEGMQATNPYVRRVSAVALSGCGTNAMIAFPMILNEVRRSNSVPLYWFSVLVACREFAAPARPHLFLLLSDRDFGTDAASVLARMDRIGSLKVIDATTNENRIAAANAICALPITTDSSNVPSIFPFFSGNRIPIEAQSGREVSFATTVYLSEGRYRVKSSSPQSFTGDSYLASQAVLRIQPANCSDPEIREHMEAALAYWTERFRAASK